MYVQGLIKVVAISKSVRTYGL